MTRPAQLSWWYKIIKWIARIVVAIWLLIILIVILLQFYFVQSFIKNRAVNYLHNKLHTKVAIASLHINWLDELDLKGVYIEDEQHKPLLYSGDLHVEYNLPALLQNKIVVKKLRWQNVRANIYRLPGDTDFNYQFIVTAFAGNKPPDTINKKGTSLQYKISTVALSDFKLNYNDAPGGMKASLRFDSIILLADVINPDSMVFKLDKFAVKNLYGAIKISPSSLSKVVAPKTADTISSPLPYLSCKNFTIDSSHIIFENASNGFATDDNIPSLGLKNLQLDLAHSNLNLNSIALNNITASVRLQKGLDTAEIAAASKDSTGAPFHIAVKKVSIKNTQLSFNNDIKQASVYKNAIDFNHIVVNPLNLEADNISYRDSLMINIESGSLHEKSDFTLQQLHGNIIYSPTQISLRNLLLQTNNSRISKLLVVHVPSWTDFSKHLNEVQLEINFDSAQIALGDALYFAPQLADSPFMKPLLDKQLQINAKLGGSLTALKIPQLFIRDNVGNLLQLHGSIAHVMETKKLSADITIAQLHSGNKSIRSWLPPGTLPEKFQSPKQFSLQGFIKGGLASLQTALHFKSTSGNVQLKATLQQITNKKLARYNATFNIDHLQAGELAGDTSLGIITANGSLSGHSLDPNIMDAQVKLQIDQLEYKHYAYHAININAAIAEAAYQFHLLSKDTSLSAEIQLQGSAQSNHPSVNGNINLNKADLFATHLSAQPLTVEGNFALALSNLAPRHLSGTANIDQLQIATSTKVIPVDTIKLLASDSLQQQYLSLSGPFGTIHADGNYDYTKVQSPLIHLIQYHLQPDTTNKIIADTTHQTLQLSANIIWPAAFKNIVPSLEMPSPLTFQARLNSDSNLLTAQWKLPVLKYNELQIDSLNGNININEDSLKANISLQKLDHPTFPLQKTSVHIAAAKGIINTNILLLDKKQQPNFELGAKISMLPDSVYVLQLHQNILLNKEHWNVPADNIIKISKGQLNEANVILKHGDQKLAITSQPRQGSAVPDLQVNIDNFHLSEITGFISRDTLLADGLLQANASIKNWEQSPLINADLSIDSLKLENISAGNLTLHAKNNAANIYAIDLALNGAGNNVTLNGNYNTKNSAQALNFKLNLQPLHLNNFASITSDYITELSGNLLGSLAITASTTAPQVLGELHFENTGFNLTYINSYLQLQDEHIFFKQDGIHFNNFVVQDSLGDEMVLNGQIATSDYHNIHFNLNLTANNFEILGPQQSGAQNFYGPAYIDADIKARGTPSFPIINMNVKLLEKSYLTIAIPQSQPGVANREGVIKFINPNNPIDSSLLSTTDTMQVAAPAALKGMAFSGTIVITPDATIKILIDPQNGDSLVVKGNATLNATVNPGGEFNLTGQYEINEGKYELSLSNLIKRSFNIQKGSTITWEGSPKKANVNITAVYLADPAAIDLLQDQLSGSTKEMRGQYNQKEPVQVYLMIQGKMMKPEISFRLDMPPDHQNDLGGALYARIKQINNIPSELNKQVMGLLVLNSFIPDNPSDIFAGGSGGGAEAVARGSVSKILSQQLNNLAGKLIKGFDVNFDLQSQQSYASGTAQNTTALNVAVSKHLFNNRITVSVGNDFALEGNPRQANGIAGDIAVEYRLSRDGRYRLRAYRKNDTEEIIEGQVIETGLTFSLVVDYNKFKEILQKSKEKKEKKLRKKENKK